MKNKIWFLVIIIIALFSACNENDAPVVDLPDVEVSIHTVLQGTSGEDLLKSGTYDRAGAPVYVAGVNISAVHNDYDYPVDREYLFVDEGDTGDPVSMTVKAGSNTFNATSIATYDPFALGIENMNRSSETAILDRVEDYADSLKSAYPSFVTYTSNSVTQEIEFNADNNVNLTMTADQGRVNIVFDTEIDVEFAMTAELYDADNILLETRGVLLEYTDKASAIIYNRSDMTDGSYVKVTIAKNAHNVITSTEQIVAEKTIDVSVGENITHLFNYNGIETTDAGFGLTFEPFDDSNSSTEITE